MDGECEQISARAQDSEHNKHLTVARSQLVHSQLLLLLSGMAKINMLKSPNVHEDGFLDLKAAAQS